MNTSDYLQSLQSDLSRTITALDLEQGTDFTDIATMAENGDISTGGSGWKRPSDWWNTESILTNAEIIDNMYPLYIVLLPDYARTTTFTKTTSYKALRFDGILTSDGEWYTEDNSVHTWDTTKDKPCSLGYKTRYFIVYGSSKTLSGNVDLIQFPCLEVVSVDEEVIFPNITFGSSTGGLYVNRAITNVKIAGAISNGNLITFENCPSLKKVYLKTTKLANNCFKACSGLEIAELPTIKTVVEGCFYNAGELKEVSLPKATTLNKSAFQGASGIQNISLPLVTSIGQSCFHNCSSIEKISMPSLTSITSQSAFYGCYCLIEMTLPSNITTSGIFGNCFMLHTLNLPNNFATTGLDITASRLMSVDSLNDMLSKLSSNGSGKTLTLGSDNLAKLTSEEIAVGTAKGWTIN